MHHWHYWNEDLTGIQCEFLFFENDESQVWGLHWFFIKH